MKQIEDYPRSTVTDASLQSSCRTVSDEELQGVTGGRSSFSLDGMEWDVLGENDGCMQYQGAGACAQVPGCRWDGRRCTTA